MQLVWCAGVGVGLGVKCLFTVCIVQCAVCSVQWVVLTGGLWDRNRLIDSDSFHKGFIKKNS